MTQIKQASGAFALSVIGVRTRDLEYHDVFEGNPMKSACILLVMFSVLGFSIAQAQTTVDVAKITCRQFLLGHVGGSTRSVANWLSGYYNGKRGNTVIEVGSMRKNVHDLERYCRKHYEMPVMDAAKTALGAEK